MNFHRILLIVLIASVLAAAGISIAQMWFDALNWAVFIKLLATLAIVFVIAGFLMVVKSDFGAHKRLKDENYLD